MAHATPYPETATLHRLQVIQSLVQRVFAITYTHLSKLHGRTVAEYCRKENIPKYIERFFTPADNELIKSSEPVDYSVKLSYKLLKTCCGLENPMHEKWSSDKDKSTFEYLIILNWTQYENLRQGSAVTDNNLNLHMDTILQTLILLLEKVEAEKSVDESKLKSELRRKIGEELNSYDNASCCQHMYAILTEHSIHQMLVMVYRHMNRLGKISLSDYLNRKNINLISRTALSNEQRFLDSDPPPEKIPVRMLFRIVRRVCFSFSLRRGTRSAGLEAILRDLKRQHNDQPKSEAEYTEKCYAIYKTLNTVLQNLCVRSGKEMRVIIGNLAKETFVTESIERVCESPATSSISCVSTGLQISNQQASSSVPLPALPQATPRQNTLTIEEVNISVLFRVMRPGSLVSQTLAVVFLALKGSFKMSRTTWKNYFTSDEKDYLKDMVNKPIDKNVLSKRDVTFLCKILRHSCPLLSANDEVWSTNGNTIEFHITLIRKERNKLAHDITSITTQELNNELYIIENCLLTILGRTEGMLAAHEQTLKTEVQTQTNIVKAEMQKVTQITYDLSIMDMWTEMNQARNKIKSVAQEELKHPGIYRENLACMSPISGSSDRRHDSLTIQEVFMQRELQDDLDTTNTHMYAIKDLLFTQMTSLHSSKVIIIHGRPGDGKTSICKYMFHLWAEDVKESSRNGVELLFYIPCRYVTAESLSSYLKAKLPHTFGGTRTDDVIPFLQEPQVTFLFDGYDEGRAEAKGLIEETLTSLPDSKVLITTKSQWLPKLVANVKKVTTRYKILSMVPMSEERREEYIRKLFNAMKRDEEDCNAFLRYLDKMKDNLHTLVHLPLTFSLLALLWIEEPGKAKKIRTLPQLYHKLFDLILKRITKQLGKDDPFLCREWMLGLGNLAWNNLKKNKHYITEQDQVPLKRKSHSLGLGLEGNNHMVSSLLYCEIHESLVATNKIWTFTLITQQIYFAAEYLVDKLINDRHESLLNILDLPETIDEKYKEKLQRMTPVLEFITGLLVIHDGVTEGRVEELARIMSVKESWCFTALKKMFNCLQENQETKGVLESAFVGERMSVFDHFECSSVLWVLRNTAIEVERDVTLTCSVSEVAKLKSLLEYLLLESRRIKVIVEIDRETNIRSMVEFATEKGYDVKPGEKDLEYIGSMKEKARREMEFMEREHRNEVMEGADGMNAEFVLIEEDEGIKSMEKKARREAEFMEKGHEFMNVGNEDKQIKHTRIYKNNNMEKKPKFEIKNTMRDKQIRFYFSPCKPLCISQTILNWPFSTPLFLSLHSQLFPLLWWECLMCLLTMGRSVTKLICSPADPRVLSLVEEGAEKLSANLVTDGTLAPTEVVIYASM